MADVPLVFFLVGLAAGGWAVWVWRGLWGPPCGPYTIERLKIEEWFHAGRLADRARQYEGFFEE